MTEAIEVINVGLDIGLDRDVIENLRMAELEMVMGSAL